MIGKLLSNGAVGVYKKYVSKDYNEAQGSHCMYEPSCSLYMRDSVKQDGLWEGVMQGAFRLQRCTSDAAAYYYNEFGQTLLKCPTESIDQRFHFDTPEDRSRVVKLKNLVEQSRTLYESGDKVGSSAVQKEWTRMLKDDLLFRVEDRPGQDHTQPSEFHIYHDDAQKLAAHTPGGSKKVSGLRSALAAVAGVVGGVVGAAVAGLGLGLVHLAGAAVIGVAAGTGKTDQLNARIAQKFGPATVYGVAPIERQAGRVGHSVFQKINQWTTCSTLASVAGVGVGLPVALAVGLGRGLKEGMKSGYLGGKILATNVVNCTGVSSCTCGCSASHGMPTL